MGAISQFELYATAEQLEAVAGCAKQMAGAPGVFPLPSFSVF